MYILESSGRPSGGLNSFQIFSSAWVQLKMSGASCMLYYYSLSYKHTPSVALTM